MKILSTLVEFHKIPAFALLTAASSLAACGGGDSCKDTDECIETSTENEDGELNDDLDDDTWQEEEKVREVISETAPLEIFYPQSVRWRHFNLTFEAAELFTETYTEASIPYRIDRTLTLSGTVENRLEKTESFNPNWILVLADGEEIYGDQSEDTELEPEATGSYQVVFDLPESADLEGALIEPSIRGHLGEEKVLRVPLDQAFESPYPFVIDSLNGLKMQSVDPESHNQWEMTILSAQITLNTDGYGDGRPDYGIKFVELVIEAVLVSGNDDIFSDNDFELLVDGYSVLGHMNIELLHTNQRATDILLFEIDEEVTEFEFLYDLDCCTDGIEPQRVLVTLPPVEG